MKRQTLVRIVDADGNHLFAREDWIKLRKAANELWREWSFLGPGGWDFSSLGIRDAGWFGVWQVSGRYLRKDEIATIHTFFAGVIAAHGIKGTR